MLRDIFSKDNYRFEDQAVRNGLSQQVIPS